MSTKGGVDFFKEGGGGGGGGAEDYLKEIFNC